jgi:co-chaperonin GroES (HSP10)
LPSPSGPRRSSPEKAGSRILVRKFSVADMKVDGEDVLIVCEDEVLAILG